MKVTSSFKIWLYLDQLLKPEEQIMYWHAALGGLGGLITAANPSFRTSLFQYHLFRYHVLEDTTLPSPGFPPFYSPEFFSKIRQVHQDTPLNVSQLTEKQWYQILMEDTFMAESDRGEKQQILCRVERANQGTDCPAAGRGR